MVWASLPKLIIPKADFQQHIFGVSAASSLLFYIYSPEPHEYIQRGTQALLVKPPSQSHSLLSQSSFIEATDSVPHGQ